MSDEVVYRSEVRIERVKGPVRRAWLPAEKEPVIFGVHGNWQNTTKCRRKYWNLTPRPWTTLSRQRPVDLREPLEARWRRVKSMHRTSDSCRKRWAKSNSGAVFWSSRRIHVRLKLKKRRVEPRNRTPGAAIFADKCPIYLSLKAAIQITTELILEPPDASI